MHAKFTTSNHRLVSSLGHYETAISILLGYFVFFNLTDLLSTAWALGRGLVESNGVLVGLAHFLGLDIIVTMGLTKIGFVFGACFLGILGIRTKNSLIRGLAFWSIVAFVAFFSLVTYSNLIVIITNS